MDLKQELETVQISIYCNIVSMLLKEHKTLSLAKLIVFSYLVKKEALTHCNIFTSNIKKDIINKYLSLLSGDIDRLFASYEYILKAINILNKNGFIDCNGIFISKTNKLNTGTFLYVYEENKFTKKVIEKTKTMSDAQFMREVLSNV